MTAEFSVIEDGPSQFPEKSLEFKTDSVDDRFDRHHHHRDCY